ncbi:MAG TPA: ABC transporter permease [Gemmatimonadales bacterium]
MNVIKTVLRDRRAAVGLGVLALLAIVAVFAPWIAPHDPLAQPDILRTRFLGPFTTAPDGTIRWLGTDQLGRDLLSRLMFGARISLSVGLLAAVIAVALGTAVGSVAALFGGAVEGVLMALTDAALALPRVVLLLALVALFNPSFGLVVIVLGFTGWMPVARLARGEVKGIMAQPYAAAAVAAGASPARLLLRHLLPNALTPMIVAGALGVGNAIGLEAGLSFLGLGVPAPGPSWGNMIASGRDALIQAPWIATLPGLAVVAAVVGCNLVGDGLLDALDPAATGSRPG